MLSGHVAIKRLFNLAGLLFFQGLINLVCPAQTLNAQSFREVVDRNGCSRCHDKGPNQCAPEFYDIALKYRDDLRNYRFSVLNVNQFEDIPNHGKAIVIVASDGEHLLSRAFDHAGKLVADHKEDFQGNKSQSLYLRYQQKLKSVDNSHQQKDVDEARAKLFESVLENTFNFSRSWSRQRLISVVKHGGKGEWGRISKGVPMPRYGEKLTDSEIEAVVDGILGVTKLKILTQGLGRGTVSSNEIGQSCNDFCEVTFDSPATLTLTALANDGSRFDRFEGDASGDSSIVTLVMDQDRSVRAWFVLDPGIPQLDAATLSPETIQAFLSSNPQVNSAARFLDALPDDLKFEENWVLMTRSESLQTGIARQPRIILRSKDANHVFTIGLVPHVSYPGSHPDVIEYMQWDGRKEHTNFRFHEIMLTDVPELSAAFPNGEFATVTKPRPRGVSIDDAKCSKCHSTQNVINRSEFLGTGEPLGLVGAKGKPNWDAYDSWGGLLVFNRDRIYQGTVDAAAFRDLFNPWNWAQDRKGRDVFEQLEMQPANVGDENRIKRYPHGAFEGMVQFAFDDSSLPPPLVEPAPNSDETISVSYEFDRKVGSGATETTVLQGGDFLLLNDSESPENDEGRGVELFDEVGGLDGNFNQQRIADEIEKHQFATGNARVDVRPIVLAIANDVIVLSESNDSIVSITSIPIDVPLEFFDQRNGLSLGDLYKDTKRRAESLPRRKVDLQYRNLSRINETYLSTASGGMAGGLISEFGQATSQGLDLSFGRLRQEIFRRPLDGMSPDNSELGGRFVDRELYAENTKTMTLFRYFLEPLGVPVDRWSLSVRGRSRTYTFADVFGTYKSALASSMEESLRASGDLSALPDAMAEEVMTLVNRTLSRDRLPPANQVPTFVDIQRILNKSCIECHGGLHYPPYSNHGKDLDLSEDESPTDVDSFARLRRSYRNTVNRVSSTSPNLGFLYRLLNLHEDNSLMMPFEGPSLSKADIETIRRWIVGGSIAVLGDQKIVTIDGVEYDFLAVGEFVLLRDIDCEIQMRRHSFNLTGSDGDNGYDGLENCVSLTSALAMRIGKTRVTFQGRQVNGIQQPTLEVRIDGQLVDLSKVPILIPSGGRLFRPDSEGPIKFNLPSGSEITVAPVWLEQFQTWCFSLIGSHLQQFDGLAGRAVPGNWLPKLRDDKLLGHRPESILDQQRLIIDFANSYRVADDTSLFDYPVGGKPSDFSLTDWPRFNNSNVFELPSENKHRRKFVRKDVGEDDATKTCSEIADQKLRQRATDDYIKTGERSLVSMYVALSRMMGNRRPSAPQLAYPPDGSKDLPTNFDFTWKASTDQDGDKISYRLLVRSGFEGADSNLAERVPMSNASQMWRNSNNLKPGLTYYWTVTADDGKGGIVESDTHMFRVKK